MGRGRRTLTEYKVTLTVEEGDVLRRITLLNSAAFRLLHVSRLRRIVCSDYEGGRLVLLVVAEEASPEVVPGAVKVEVEVTRELAA